MTAAMLRARSDEQKARRRDDILRAADALLAESGGRMVPAAEVARRAGLAKGTLYLYFRSKEAIFLELLSVRFDAWADAVSAALLARPPKTDPSAFIAAMCAYVAARPDFLRLAAMSNAILEQNVVQEAALRYKAHKALMLRRLGRQVEAVWPTLTPGSGAALLLHSYALILGLWQLAEPPAPVKEMIAAEGLVEFQFDFETQLRAALGGLWRGSL